MCAGLAGAKYISFEERQWHSECFTCMQCSVSLVGRGFLTQRDNILCTDCGREKWPFHYPNNNQSSCPDTDISMNISSSHAWYINKLWMSDAYFGVTYDHQFSHIAHTHKNCDVSIKINMYLYNQGAIVALLMNIFFIEMKNACFFPTCFY